MKKTIPTYLKKIILENPQLKSGRKSYEKQHERILKQIKLIKKFKEKKF